jgi:PAS domain S-box-containing protein
LHALRADGSQILVELTVTPIIVAGQPAFTGFLRDISKQKQAERALKMTKFAIDGATDAVHWIKQDGRFFYVNDAACRSLGYSRDELLSMSVADIDPNISPQDWADRWKNIREKRSATTQSDNRAKDGRVFPVEVSMNYLEFDGDEFCFAFVRDITDRESMERQLRQSQKMDAVGQLTGGIAHDFNNLLTIIIGNLQLVEESLKKEEADFVKEALDGALRGAELTERLLAFSRRQLLAPEVININELVTEIESLLTRSLREDIGIVTKLAGDLWLAAIDRSQLENSIVNLSINARDAMPNGGTLTIKTDNTVLDDTYAANHDEVSSGDYVLLTISDNGIGIPKDILPHVFEPFFSTKDRGKGTGLGLSMVYGFVKQSGGHISIYSEEGQGTVVRVYLPRSHSATEDTGTSSTRREGIPSGEETILVVEDDAAVRKIAITLLTALGYRVLEANCGAQALALIDERQDIDLLFTDMIMPGGMTGAELARQALRQNPTLKVLFTSGYTDTVILDKEMLLSSEKILSKPYLRHQLAQKVREVLDDGNSL